MRVRSKRVTRAALCSLLVLSGFACVLGAQQTYAFVDVAVLPMTSETVMEHQTVLIQNGSVARIGSRQAVTLPTGTLVIDGKGKYLMPGLGDAHAHLSSPGGGTALAERAVQLYALHGVTMIRSMYTEPHHLEVARRITTGALLGPRIHIVSPALTGQTAPTPAAAADSIARYTAAGFQVIKLLPGLSRETFDTVVAVARRNSVRIAGHVPASVGLQRMLTGAPESIEHLDGFLEALVRAPSGRGSGFFGLSVVDLVDTSGMRTLAAEVKRSGAVVVPTEFEMETFVAVDSGASFARDSSMRFVPRPLLEQWVRAKDNFVRASGVTEAQSKRYRDLRRRLIAELNAAGVPIAAGSDAFNQFDVPGEGLFRELEIYVAAGLTPYAALRSATVDVARLMHDRSLSGTIAQGAPADLLLLNANPLSAISNLRRPSGVMLRGVWYPADSLAARLSALDSSRE